MINHSNSRTKKCSLDGNSYLKKLNNQTKPSSSSQTKATQESIESSTLHKANLLKNSSKYVFKTSKNSPQKIFLKETSLSKKNCNLTNPSHLSSSKNSICQIFGDKKSLIRKSQINISNQKINFVNQTKTKTKIQEPLKGKYSETKIKIGPVDISHLKLRNHKLNNQPVRTTIPSKKSTHGKGSVIVSRDMSKVHSKKSLNLKKKTLDSSPTDIKLNNKYVKINYNQLKSKQSNYKKSIQTKEIKSVMNVSINMNLSSSIQAKNYRTPSKSISLLNNSGKKQENSNNNKSKAGYIKLKSEKDLKKGQISKKTIKVINSNNKYMSMPVSKFPSIIHTKNNSKSVSRIEEVEFQKKIKTVNNFLKTHSSIKNTYAIHSFKQPKSINELSQSLLDERRLKVENLKKISKNKKSEINIQKESICTNNEILTIEDVSLNKIMNTSTYSTSSLAGGVNYFQKECDKLVTYILKYFLKNNEYPKTNLKFYKYGRLLGKGAFGKVNIALHTLSGKLVAIKSMNKSKLNENSKNRIEYETNLMKNLNHPSIVKIFEKFESETHILLVIEYVSCGDLLSFIKKRTKLNEQTSKFLFHQIIEGLQFIHSRNIVHRDIKLENLLIDLSGNIKICDFGVSKELKPGEIMKDQCGTPAYISPEILKNKGYKGFSSDIWSAGVVLYSMLSGNVPFRAHNMRELKNQIESGNYTELQGISEDCKEILRSMLEVDPEKRITINQILQHKWFESKDNFDSNYQIKNKLFTNAEQILLSSSNLDYKNCDKNHALEHFTMKNLDTCQEAAHFNSDTRSIILAPFNTTLRNDGYELLEDLPIENGKIKLDVNSKEANRIYELNYNGEIDNGILINHKEISSVREKSPRKNSLVLNSDENLERKGFCDYLNNKVNSLELIFSKDAIQFTNLPENKIQDFDKSNTFIINEDTVKLVEELGYHRDFIVKSLYSNEFNYATTTYYLLNTHSATKSETI